MSSEAGPWRQRTGDWGDGCCTDLTRGRLRALLIRAGNLSSPCALAAGFLACLRDSSVRAAQGCSILPQRPPGVLSYGVCLPGFPSGLFFLNKKIY